MQFRANKMSDFGQHAFGVPGHAILMTFSFHSTFIYNNITTNTIITIYNFSW